MNSKWPMAPLGEVLMQYKEYIEYPEPKIYPKLSVKLYGKGVILDAPTDGTTLKMKRHQIAKAGQVILSEIWGKKGAIGFVPPEGEGALCTSHFFLFDFDPSQIDQKYLQAIFAANYLQVQLDAEAKGTTGYAAVRPKILFDAKIPLPPLDEQRRIVARIEELAARIEEARELRRRAVEETEALLLSISRSIFNFEKKSIITIDELVGRANLKNGLSVKSMDLESKVRCLRVSAMRDGEIDCLDSKPIPMKENEVAQYLVKDKDVFIVRGNGSKNLVGRAGIVKNAIPGIIFPDLFIRVPLDSRIILPEFFVSWWNSKAMRDSIETAAKTTSGIWKINQGHIASFSIPLPELEEQQRVIAYLEGFYAKIDALHRHQSETAAALDALLPAVLERAFRGEL